MLPVHCNAEPHSLSDLISILDMYDTGEHLQWITIVCTITNDFYYLP
mgnify:CR=1 FL=1